jgi:flagella basal body P-ring formation protein FlgA
VRKIVIGILGALLMLGSIGGYLYFMKSTEVKVTTMHTLKPVRLLNSGEIIDSSMVRSVPISVAAHSSDAIEDTKVLVGKVVSVPISQNEELLVGSLLRFD